MADFTKQAIRAAFIKLLNEKPFKQITVRDIVEECGVNRNTFYYHYSDIPQLLESIIQEDAERTILAQPQLSSLEDCLETALRFALENRRAMMHIYHSASRDMYEQYQWRVCEQIVTAYLDQILAGHTITEKDHNLMVNYVTCICFGIIMGWLEKGMQADILADIHRLCQIKTGTVEEMIEFCERHPN